MTTKTQPTVATPTRSRATRAFGLCAAVGVLLTANAAFASPVRVAPEGVSSPAAAVSNTREGAATPSVTTASRTTRSESSR